MHTITSSDYEEACDSYQGICLACGELQDSVEPDAEGYQCDSCGAFEVMGMEEALLMGEIEIG